MNPFESPLFTMIVFIVFVGLLAAFVTFRQKRSKAALVKLTPFEIAVRKGFDGTEEEWKASLTRKQLRRLQFANQTDDELRDRMMAAQAKVFQFFLNDLVIKAALAAEKRPTLHDFTLWILTRAEEEMTSYLDRSAKPDVAAGFLPDHHFMIMRHSVKAIIEYARQLKVTGTQAIGLELMKFVERNFRVKGLNGVLYRNKGTVPYGERCEAMSRAVLKYFDKEISVEYVDAVKIPFDYLVGENMISNDDFRRDFFEEAIDDTFRAYIKNAERNSFGKLERVRDEEHSHNRRQRKRRVTKSSKRR